MLDAVGDLRGDDRFGVVGDAEAGGLQHGQIIGAVTHRKSGFQFYAAVFRQLVERRQFGILVQNRLGDLAG